MAPESVPPKSQRTPLARSDESGIEEQSQPGSQSSDDNRVTRLATEMQREAKQRREARRTLIKNAHREAVKKIENAMTERFEDITKRMVKRHRLRMDRLSYLIQRRSGIEAKMFARSQKIENAFIYADKALAFAFGRRVQDIVKQQKEPTA